MNFISNLNSVWGDKRLVSAVSAKIKKKTELETIFYFSYFSQYISQDTIEADVT